MPAWRAIARHWDTISTGIHHRRDISPVAAELDDVVLRSGRLAYDNPRWTPAGADASLTRDPAGLAATASELKVVLAAVHHAIDAISRIAAGDTDAVRDAASGNRLYLPTRLLPEHYDIPCPYAPAPPAHAAELLGCYHTAATATRRAAAALDQLAVATGSPSSMLPVARLSSGSPVTARRPADDDRKQTPALPAPPPGIPRAQAGDIEDILRSLHITEPGMLLRAAAIDDAARDVLAHATASSRKRDSISQQPPQRKPATPGDAARTAAKDVTPGAAETRQHLTPAGPASGPPAGRAPQRGPRNSPGHCPAI